MYIVTFEPRGVANVLIKGSDLSVAEFATKLQTRLKNKNPAAARLPEVHFGQLNPSEDLH